ncbi:hypothetical protein [Streptomyces melanosporofaciens]|uniref:hypothetical protein n=1 Tax=Streptomyces melanosporofaciens TaxID=67327 RepID=UPI00115FAF40|nr:hypothetical protein [Streptomyces melanosporofaciens]
MDLLRWFRFLWAAGDPWERATRLEPRDFSRWLLVAGQPKRSHWRSRDVALWSAGGKPYAASVRAHSETVLRGFYDFHLDAGTGPILSMSPVASAIAWACWGSRSQVPSADHRLWRL